MNDAWREALTAFEGLDVKVERSTCRSMTSGYVVAACINTRTRTRQAAFDLGQLSDRGANLFHVREGQGHQARPLLHDRERAFEAVGLSE